MAQEMKNDQSRPAGCKVKVYCKGIGWVDADNISDEIVEIIQDEVPQLHHLIVNVPDVESEGGYSDENLSNSDYGDLYESDDGWDNPGYYDSDGEWVVDDDACDGWM